MSCSNGYCYITGYRKGQHTNGVCRCLDPLPTKDRLRLQSRLAKLELEIRNLKSEGKEGE